MVLLKGLAAIISLASIATCSPLDSEASSGALGLASAPGLPAIAAVAPIDHALEPANLPHMPADLATGQLAPHSQKGGNHNGETGIEKMGSHKGIEAGRNGHSHAKHQYFDPGQNRLSPLTSEEKTLAPAPKLAIREVIERGIANIGARSDPPAQSFIQALGNMFSGLGKDKSKRDAPPALPAPPGPALGAVNASTPPNNPNPAAGVPPPSQDNTPTPPAPAVPAPVPAEAVVSPPAPQSPPGSPPSAGLPPSPPPADPNSAPASLAAASPPVADLSPAADIPAPPATPVDAVAPPAAQPPLASNANSPSNPPAAPPAVDTGASPSPLDSTAPHDFKSVPASPGAVAQDGHMGQFGPQSGLLGAQQHHTYRNGAPSAGSHLNSGNRMSGGPTGHHRQHHQGMNPYGRPLPAINHHMPQAVPSDFQASLMVAPRDEASMTGSSQQITAQRHYYLNRRNIDFTPLPQTRRSLQARNRVYYRRDESSASAGASDEPAEKKTGASEAATDDKPVKSDDTAESTPAAKAETADSSAESKSKKKTDTKSAEKTADIKAADKSKDDTVEKAADLKASEKSKAETADEPTDDQPQDGKSTDDKPVSKPDATKSSTDPKNAARKGKHLGSMPTDLDSSFSMGGAEDAPPKKHDHHAPKPHNKGSKSHHSAHPHSKGRKPKAKAPAYKPRPKGHRTRPTSKKPSLSEHHSSRFNPHHKMIPQIARRYDLQARNAAAEADAWVDAHAKYLGERDVYTGYYAKRGADAYPYPEAWACSDPSACN